MAKRQFTPGMSTYKCVSCGKLTRDTGDEGGTGVCKRCYELGEWINTVLDGLCEIGDVPEKFRAEVAAETGEEL